MIAVVTLQFGSLSYFPHSTRINRAYCDRHGYDFIVSAPDDPPLGDRNPVWYKVRRVADLLPRYDSILWMDADAWFHDHNRRIEHLIDERMPPECVLMLGTDRRDKHFAWSDTAANTGTFLVRNAPVAQQILEEWWRVPLHDSRTGHEWPIEQRAFNCHVLPRWHAEIKLIDYRLMNGRDGNFIRHAANEPRDVRAQIIRDASEAVVGPGGGA